MGLREANPEEVVAELSFDGKGDTTQVNGMVVVMMGTIPIKHLLYTWPFTLIISFNPPPTLCSEYYGNSHF